MNESSDTLDLNAYLDRLGLPREPLPPTLETLRRLVAHHVAAIPFESLNPWLGLPVPLEMARVAHKLVADRRGGYCFEQNRLFSAVLRTLGFEVDHLIARVLWGQPDDARTQRSHMLLRVEIDGTTHLADVGFGGQTLTGTLQLVPDVEQPTPHGPFRLVEHDGTWRMRALMRDEWRTLYRFDLAPQWLLDYEAPNHYTATHPASRFVNHLIAARAPAGRRLALLDREFASHPTGGATQRRTIASATELLDVLATEFGLALNDDLSARLRARFPGMPAPEAT